MFRDFINTPIDPIPCEYAQTLQRPHNEPDWALTCLGIALLKPRIEGYGGIQGCYYLFDKLSECVNDFKARVEDTYPMLCYYIYNNIDEDYDIAEELADFKEKKSISQLVKDKSGNDCHVFYLEDSCRAAIFINTRDMRLYHLLMSFISLYFPSLFKTFPMKDEDFELVKTLSKKERVPFITEIRRAVQPYVLEFRKMQLATVIKTMHESKVNQAFIAVEKQRVLVRQMLQNYGEAIQNLHDLSVTYEGLKTVEANDQPEEELVDYIATNKALNNMQMNGTKLSFSVATRLINYNPDAYEIFKRKGAIFDGNYTCNGRGTSNLLDVFTSRENRKKFMDHIFSETPDLSVKLAGNYILDLQQNIITTNGRYEYEKMNPMFENYMINPHLKFYNCLGGYEARIHNILSEGNYIGAIELCVASAGSIDLDETEQTFRPFLGLLMSSTKKVIVTNDGMEMTPEEAMLWIIDKEKANETDCND